MDRRQRNTPKKDGQDSEDDWSMLDAGSAEEAPPATTTLKRKRVTSSAQEFLRSATSPDNLDNLRQIVSDASAGIQNMIPNIDFGGRKGPPGPLPMNYVKTTRPTIMPNTPAVAPAQGNVERPAAKMPKLDEFAKLNNKVYNWMEQVNPEEQSEEDALRGSTKLSASAQAFLADSNVTIESLGRGVSDARTGFLSRPASQGPAQSPYDPQTPGAGTPENASGRVSSGILSDSMDCDPDTTAGAFLGYDGDSNRAGLGDSEESRRRAVLNRLTRSDLVYDSADSELRTNPHLPPYRKDKRSNAPTHDGFYDVDLFGDDGAQADDEKETPGRPRKPRGK